MPDACWAVKKLCLQRDRGLVVVFRESSGGVDVLVAQSGQMEVEASDWLYAKDTADYRGEYLGR